jgi:hypothetical protein
MAADDASGRFFARRAPWDWRDGAVVILDDDGEVTHTLDGWQTLVFHQADGGRTVAEFLRMLKARPDVDGSGRPIDQTDDVIAALAALTDDLHVVELRDVSDDLAPEHDLPASER